MVDAGEDPKPQLASGPLQSRLKLPTTGGWQFWSDELVFRGWRIQRHAITSSCRLLDSRNLRHASGGFDECFDRLEAIKRQEGLAPVTGHAVIALHGLGRTRNSMAGMCKYLRNEGGYHAINVSYASTRHDVAGHARGLAKIISYLPEVERIDFVAHSLGNLIIRHYLADQTDASTGKRPDERIGRIVMLAPPNGGAEMAVKLRNNPLFWVFTGRSGMQLAVDWEAFQQRLATPQCPFGIIAGGRGRPMGTNPLLAGDDDLIVSVAETRLEGAADFVVVPVYHTFIMNDGIVREYTLRFLQHGFFVNDEGRQPL